MRIPEQTIDDIRRAIDIVEIVGGVVKLKRRGKNFLGLCPFHQEKTPSFNVNPDMQIYKCFGCGKGGNVFQFVMETERVSFVEAVRSLAERAGITIPEEGKNDPAQAESDQIYAALRFAGNLFFEHLTKTDEGRSALTYFQRRGFTEETIRTFGLGYSLNMWDHLLKKATDAGLKQDDLLKAGLLRRRDDGTVYDYFRGRAMFPILTSAGRVVGFGARKMRDDDPIQGKYINSPETPVYSKSRILFGLSHAKESIRKEDAVLLVEGYADMISLFQAGVQNVVASSGTALTEEQLDLLGRYSKNLVLVYDGDSAGSQATIRGIDLALEKDLDVRIVALPQGEDPDTMVRKQGAKAFRELLAGAVSFIDFKASQYVRMGLFATPEGKTKAVRSIVKSIAKIRDELKRSFFIKDVAERYGVYESILLKELEQWRDSDRRLSRPFEPARQETQPVPEPTAPAEIPAPERALLKIFLLGHRDAMEYVLANLNEADLADARVTTLIHMVLESVERSGAFDIATAIDAIEDPHLKDVVTDTVMRRYELSSAWEEMEKEIEAEDPMKVARDAVMTIRRRAIHNAMNENQKALKEAQRLGGDSSAYLQTQKDLLHALKELENRA